MNPPPNATKRSSASSASGATITTIRAQLDALSGAITAADATITEAERAGVLVDEGRTALREAREHQVTGHVLVHAFAEAPFLERATSGLDAARRAQEAGDAALRELDTRRRGLAVATLLILVFLVVLGMKIRRLPPPSADDLGTGDSSPTGGTISR